MHFGQSVGVACASFAITNIDDMFVLVTFFSEASTSATVTPFRIVLGQFIGFTVITTISLIGFGVSFLIPTEPIGFLGFVPLLLGVWKLFDLLLTAREEEEEKISSMAGIRSTLKVSLITVMNGGDNIGTYVPLFARAQKGDIAIYVVVYYILLGVWCFVAFIVMRQRHILALARRYMRVLLPLLYIGLGLYIIIKSSSYPWSIEHINKSVNKSVPTHPGKIIMSVVTTFFLSTCIGVMLWFKWRKKAAQRAEVPLEELPSPTQTQTVDSSHIAV